MKQDKKMLNDLETAGEEKILEALKLAEEKGNDSLIPVVISLALTHKSEVVVNAATELLRSVKSKALIPSIIEAIGSSNKVADRKKLVALCWECSIKCDPYLSFFTELAINEPFEVALEAITVIEEMEGKMDVTDVENAIFKTETAISSQPEKATLLAGLMATLKSFR